MDKEYYTKVYWYFVLTNEHDKELEFVIKTKRPGFVTISHEHIYDGFVISQDYKCVDRKWFPDSEDGVLKDYLGSYVCNAILEHLNTYGIPF